MPRQEPTRDRAPVDLEALTDLRTPWCVRVVATLRIADHVAAGTSDVEALARAAGCHADALQTCSRTWRTRASSRRCRPAGSR